MDFIIHELLKEANRPVSDRYRDSPIEPSQKESNFVAEVTRLFRRHQSGRVFGTFERDSTTYPLSMLLRDCVDSGDFYSFSLKAARLLVAELQRTPAATGGYFFVARFPDQEEDTMLIFILSQRMGHAVNKKTLTLETVLNLEMQHLDLAARISITQWLTEKPEPISLIRGRKELSAYFKHFIGLHQDRTNTEATQNLKKFTEEWVEERGYSEERKTAVLEKVAEYAKSRGNQTIDLKVVATLVDPDEHEAFFERANEAGLAAEFHIDRRSIAAWGRLTYSDPEIKINLARRQMNKRFRYNSKEKTLLIRNIVLDEKE